MLASTRCAVYPAGMTKDGDSADGPAGTPKDQARTARQARLAAALRQNLRRRKAPPPAPADPPPDPAAPEPE